MPIDEGQHGSRVEAPSLDEVPVIPWPSASAARHALALARRPRLLAVGEGAPPPEGVDELEDWVRVPVEIDEIRLRQRTLLERWREERAEVWLDEHGLVRHGERWVALSGNQALAAAPLVANIGRVVHRADVWRACGAARSDSSFTGILQRLRTKLAEVDVTLHILSGGRLLLEAPSSPSRGSYETVQKQLHGILSPRTEPRPEELEWTQATPRGS
jgi:hypothetical protein